MSEANVPADIVRLYRVRHNKYKTLIRLSDTYKPFVERLPNINLALPKIAALPTLFNVEEQFRRTFSPTSESLIKGNVEYVGVKSRNDPNPPCIRPKGRKQANIARLDGITNAFDNTLDRYVSWTS
jgi:hypothetical protein